MPTPKSPRRLSSRWVPEPDAQGHNLQALLAFASGLQVGSGRRIRSELATLAQQARFATMASGAAIAISHQQQIECVARSGEAAPQTGSRPQAGIGLAAECIRTGTPQVCLDTETHPIVDRLHSRTFGVRSIIYVPLLRGVQDGVQPAGVIGVFSEAPNHFTNHDLRVLQMLAREVVRLLRWQPVGIAPQREASDSARIAVAAAEHEKVPDGAVIFTVNAEAAMPSPELTQPRAALQTLLLLAVVLAMACSGGMWWHFARPGDKAKSPVSGAAQTERPASITPETQPTFRVEEFPFPLEVSAAAAGVRDAGDSSPTIDTVATQVTPGHTFVSIRLSEPRQFQVRELSAPPRIYVDLQGVQLPKQLKTAGIAPAGAVKIFRLGRYGKGVVRLVMELNSPSTYLVSVTSNPYVLVFDLQLKAAGAE
ncbi:MAG TPA: GAF domain-containing protein [Clostridia bacterium]|nr:GAF domain-containing protein [Clostridia bacterium]